MNANQLQEKLIRAARRNPPSDAVPYAFEKRIMARLQSATAPDAWTIWGRSLWRAAISCSAVAVVCGVWAFGGGNSSSASSGEDISAQLEDTFYASAAASIEESW
jgi:hypothetical protein